MTRSANIRRISLMFAVLFIMLMFSGCTEEKPLTRDGFYFDTYISISIYSAPDAESALDSAFALCKEYDVMFSRDNEQSDIWAINHAHGDPVTVHHETVDLISRGLFYSELSGGVFDITCGRVTELWDWDSETPSLPSTVSVTDALATVGWGNVQLDEQACTVCVPDGVHLDVGGIAKGFIADRIAERLRSEGCDGAIINLGGNIVVIGEKKKNKGFEIGIQSPFSETEYSRVLTVSNRSVVTAGSYQRCFELDGKEYHHILDLQTGMPADTGLASVTILTDSSCDGDALATICFLLGKDNAEMLLSILEQPAEAYFITDNGEVVHYSHEAAVY